MAAQELPEAELHTAFAWICDQCGKRNYLDGIRMEFVDGDLEKVIRQEEGLEDWEELPEEAEDSSLFAVADEVDCPNCGTTHRTNLSP